ncbi:hypothetical protein N8Z63_02255 [Octadecabacter sp.]|nr:hypothetical protein [Octadecabacter sp.]
MVENFGGFTNLVIWVLLFIGAAFYSFRCLFQTKAFNDQYGFGDSCIFMTRFAGTQVGAAAVISLVLLVNGPEGSWAFVAWGWTQSLLAAVFGFRTIKSDWANIEGVKATAEGYLAPTVFLILNTILLLNMGDILYG